MERLTYERCNGIKQGYWSPDKKETLVQRLAEYENTGLEPEEILELKRRNMPMEVNVRYTEYHCGKAVIKDRKQLPAAMQKLAGYEDAEESGAWPFWTSVRKALPKIGEMVLVTCRTKKGAVSINRAYCDAECIWHGSGSMAGVVAWMPLPEPYEEETDGRTE